jgi:hypothetical protein
MGGGANPLMDRTVVVVVFFGVVAMVREWCVFLHFGIEASKRASRQNGVRFFNISNFKNCLRMVCL